MIYEKKNWPPQAAWCREIPFLKSQWSEPGRGEQRRLAVSMEAHGIQVGADHMMPVCQVRGRCATGELAKTWGSVGTSVSANPAEKTITLTCADAYEGVLIVWGD